MRINKFVAGATGMSRRSADVAIQEGRIIISGAPARLSDTVEPDSIVTLDGKTISYDVQAHQTIMLNKPAGYVVSRDGQGSRTVYDLLPIELHRLKPIGRLDKDSSGLLLLTDDGKLAHQLTHPSFQKVKVYEIILSQPLQPLHRQMISEHGLQLDDGPSRLQLDRLHDGDDTKWIVMMHEGRNRQIRRTFSALGYTVTTLHRISFGTYRLNNLASGDWQTLTSQQ